MKKKFEKAALYIQLALFSILLCLLILSDFGLILPSENTVARGLLHCAAALGIISSLIQLHRKKGE